MSDELKAKLREIILEGGDKDYPSEYVWSGRALDDTIAQIDQAYKDAGYVSLPDRCRYCARGDDHYHGHNLMTGQEWYERFMRELDVVPTPPRAKTIEDAARAVEEMVMSAAKRAAGLEE